MKICTVVPARARGTNSFTHGAMLNFTRSSLKMSRTCQPAVKALTAIPKNAADMIPVACILRAITTSQATPTRPIPLIICAQPNHRKFCRPCRIPMNTAHQSKARPLA
tara:strand:- start:17865 stop:18188 length:324 start_codon:yes stop_codon:yes gene_type:complete